MKLELGCGNRPTEGYLHQDVNQLETPLDYCCNAWEIPIREGSLDEVIAIAVMEHLRFDDFERTLQHIHRLLKVGGVFLFDVPDLMVWSKYLYQSLHEGGCRHYPYRDIIKTLWGWQRWDGDEHKSAWTADDIVSLCVGTGFEVQNGFDDIKKRVHRDRFSHPENAHIFIKAIKA